MDDVPTLTSRTPAVRMGISGLPDPASSMLVGGLYVLVAKTTSARFPLLASSIAHALEDGIASAVVVSANPAQFMQRVELLAGMDTADLVASQRLQLFMLQDNFLKKMFQYGAGRFVSELEDFGIPDNSYLVFDQADELLSLHDVSLAHDQVTVLKEWFSKKAVTALLVFSRLTDAHSSTINAIMDSLDGIVRLGGEKDGLVLSFDYWQSPTAVTVAKNYQLTTLESGLYEAMAHAGMQVSLVRDEISPQQLLGLQLPAPQAASPSLLRSATAGLDQYRGYLKPLDFLREMERALVQANSGAVACTLVVGIPAQGIEISDVVDRYDRSSRLGEMITADNRHCYIYQNTDSKSLAMDNLQVILGLPVGAVFNENKLLNDHDEIRSAMVELLQAATRGDCPDFSSIHDVSPSLKASGASHPRGAGRPLKNSRNGRPASPILASQENRPHLAENALLLDFEPAKRSSTPDARIFDKSEPVNVGAIFAKSSTEPVEDIVFDVDEDIYGAVFGKTEAPRAKRSQR